MKDNPKIVIVDYGMGNLRSIQRALNNCGAESTLSNNCDEILNANKIILPGVGHFASAMNNMKNQDLISTLNEAVLIKKTPILGICLGMQIMGKYSEEGNVDGFGWIDANIKSFEVKDSFKHKVPHIGWNNTSQSNNSPLFRGISETELFYFVHSYHAIMQNDSQTIAVTNYSYDFTSAYAKDNIFGVQFHPEKSHDTGLKLLKNFIEL